MTITERIDNTTRIPASHRRADPPPPRSVKIEISPRCNYRCGFCALRTREAQPKWDMDFELFKRITRQMRDAGVEEVGVFYLGESFMNPRLLVDCIRYLKHDIGMPYVFLTSNRTREIHDALKRRCLYHWVGYPSAQRELAIVRNVTVVKSMDQVYGKRIIIMGGGAQVGQVAIGAISEADRHNIRGEHISIDTIPLVGEAALAEAVRAVAFARDGSFIAAAGGIPGRKGEVIVWDRAGNRKATIEGHADERGTREYNIGLGAKRAEAVGLSRARRSRMSTCGPTSLRCAYAKAPVVSRVMATCDAHVTGNEPRCARKITNS